MRVLIVDDSPTMRAILCAYAHDLALETAEAGDGVEGLRSLADQGPFDAVLIDWDMPRLNGLEMLRALRADARFASTKVLMVTAQNAMDRVNEALAAGADDYLMKPLDETMFAGKLCILGLTA